MNIIQYFSVNNDCYKNNVNKADSRYTTFQQRGPKGLMLHSVGCSQPSAKVFADSWNRSGKEVAVHAVLQADGTVYHCLPWNFRGWHAGGEANNTHIGVEMTEPDCIKYTGGASFTCSNKAEAQAQVQGTYKTAVELFAMLCKQYNLDPLADGVIISHREGHKRGVASNHGDPEHLWNGLGIGYTMDRFRKAVKAAMAGSSAAAPGTDGEQMYRVRKTWADAKSQIGAYRSLGNAKAACKEGYTVYDKDGNAVYSHPEPQTTEPAVDYAKNFDKAKTGTYTVNANGGLHLRAGASTSKASLEIMPNGSKVTCYGYYTGDWLYVVSASGKKGFCHSRYLKKA